MERAINILAAQHVHMLAYTLGLKWLFGHNNPTSTFRFILTEIFFLGFFFNTGIGN